MLFFCQLLLNFQGAYALIQVRSLSNLKEVLRVVSCGENNLLIMLITSLLYFCGLILMGWAEVMEVDTIYYYNRGINKIKLYYYEQNKASATVLN